MWGLTRLKLVHGQMSACQTRPATQSLAIVMFVEEVQVYHLLRD